MLRSLIMPMQQSLHINEELIRTFLREAPRPRLHWYKTLGTISSVAFLFVLIFTTLNIESYIRLSDPITIIGSPNSIVAAAVTNPIPAVQEAANVAAAPKATPVPEPTPALPSIPDDTIAISTLGISAPIHWNTPLDEKVIQSNLETGVTHLDHTPVPGQVGFAVISGHSSNFFWDKGSYNTVFAPLGKLAIGQTIQVNYKGTNYLYTVQKKYEVTPDQVNILHSDGSQSGIRLLTCTPVGTSLRRLVVEAVQTSPNPATNTAFQSPQFQGTIPAAR